MAATAAASPAGPAPMTATSNGATGAPPGSNQPPGSAARSSRSDGAVAMAGALLGGHDVTRASLDKARTLVRATVDRRETVETDADAAEHAPRLAADPGATPRSMPRGDQRRGDALTRRGPDRFPVQLDRERLRGVLGHAAPP